MFAPRQQLGVVAAREQLCTDDHARVEDVVDHFVAGYAAIRRELET